ncbi:selenocysteine-specific translation elongation factor [Methylobacterium oryzihabitans]|uniref:Selenocysteine-specific elongation factor n=1 Tax=Methylobacterium oryzihabitans TaxID=2499852 RepID=A0A3S2VY10_9HYPH|nr:selenocysteine-specific translation elongation factor [Methylobacterium oryzihabitans]RVU20314.1 selenocysteine-specific translation elongation factor [Methylobacterium oryzihabitans]
MGNETSLRSEGAGTRSLLVGVIGHVDHGKTALVRALTGTETDRLKEEQERGVSIVPGFALLPVPGGEIDLVDLPGHERFVRAMVSGATGMRAVLLAVDVREGVRPQTVEHLEIARLIGVRRGVVALTKCDLVAPDAARERAAEVAALVAAAGFDEVAVVETSVLRDQGLDDLRTRLAALLDGAGSPDDGYPYLPIDRVFTRPGFGTVVTGTLRRGPLAVGDSLVVAPTELKAAVRSLQIHGRAVQAAEPGRRTAVALRGVELSDLKRGQALAPAGLLVPSDWLDVELSAARNAPSPLAGGARLRLLVGTTEAEVRLRLLDRDELAPGETALAQLHCAEPVAVPARDPFILRLDSPSLTVGGGRVLDPASHRRKRHDPRLLADLRAIAAGRPADTLLIRLRQAGGAGAGLPDLARLVGIAPDRVRRRLTELGAREAGGRFVGPEAFAAMRGRALQVLASYHRDRPIEHGLALPRLAPLLRTDDAVAEAVLRDLVAAGEVAQDQTVFRLADFDPARNASEVVEVLEALFRRGGLTPPDEAEAVGRDTRRAEAMAYLVRAGILIRALDRVQRRTIVFHRDAVEQAKATLADAFAGSPGFLAREAGAVLGISRKFSIPLLEHLDAARFTRRTGDTRVLVEAGPGAANPS